MPLGNFTLFYGIDPGPTQSWGAALDFKTGIPELHVGPLSFNNDERGIPQAIKIGDWLREPVEGEQFMLLEQPAYRGRGENHAAGRQVQLTIAAAERVDLQARMCRCQVVKMAPVNITRNMTTYYRDKLAWHRDQKKLHPHDEKARAKFPYSRMYYVRNALNVNGLKCGRGTVLNQSHLQDAALALLAGMRYANCDHMLRQMVAKRQPVQVALI